jgi:hypothetical protein
MSILVSIFEGDAKKLISAGEAELGGLDIWRHSSGFKFHLG